MSARICIIASSPENKCKTQIFEQTQPKALIELLIICISGQFEIPRT